MEKILQVGTKEEEGIDPELLLLENIPQVKCY
jgi:hypothetical protein